MRKWRWLVGIVAAAQSVWGLLEFVEYSRSLGASADPTGAWVDSGLGLLGLLVLALPRVGIPVAVLQGLVACYALCWFPLVIVFWRAPPLTLPLALDQPYVALLILLSAGSTAVLCMLGAVGAFQVSRLTRRSACPPT